MQFQIHTKTLHYAIVMKQSVMTTFHMSSALFGDITQCMVVIPYRRVGTT